MTTTLLYAAIIAVGVYPYGRRAYWQHRARQTRAELDRLILDEVSRVLEAVDAQIAVEKIARILDNADAIHPVQVRTWDGRHWRIEDGDVTEIGAPE